MRSVKRKRWEAVCGVFGRTTNARHSLPKRRTQEQRTSLFGNNPMQGQLVRRLPALSCPQDEPGGSGVTAGSHLPMYDSNCR
jgi:hypothetical protein